MIALALAAVLVASAQVDSEVGPAPSPRLVRFAAALALGGAGYISSSVTGFDWSVAPGLEASLGFTLNDRLTVGVRGSFATLILASVAQAGVFGDYWVTNRISVGAGAGVAYWSQLTWGVLAINLPVRANVLITEPWPEAKMRTGWVIGVQLAPAINVQQQRGVPPIGIGGLVTFGFGTW